MLMFLDLESDRFQVEVELPGQSISQRKTKTKNKNNQNPTNIYSLKEKDFKRFSMWKKKITHTEKEQNKHQL